MTHPFMIARTRQKASPTGDYQRRGGQYSPPEQSLQSRSAAERFMGDFDRFGEKVARRGLPRDKGPVPPPFGRRSAEALAKQLAKSAAQTMVRSLLGRLPVGQLLQLAEVMVGVAQGAAARPMYSNYYISHVFPILGHEIGFGPGTPYMQGLAGPNAGARNAWTRGPFGARTPSGPLYLLPAGSYGSYSFEIGAAPTAGGTFVMVQNVAHFASDKWHAHHIGYTRIAGTSAPAVYQGMLPGRVVFWPLDPDIEEVPFPYPQIDPMQSPVAKPGMAPGVRPMPVPYRFLPKWLPVPGAVPGEAPARGPNREKSPWRAFDPVGIPALAPVGTGKPSTDQASGGVAVEVTAQGARLIPSEHRYTQDKKRREIKTRTLRATVALALINQVTEGTDYIDAVWEALPKWAQRLKKHRGLRIMRPQHKLEAILANYKHLSMFEVVRELFENEVVDRVFGTAGKGLKGLNRQMGRPVGVEAGGALGGGKSSVTGEKGDSPWKDWTEHLVPKTN